MSSDHDALWSCANNTRSCKSQFRTNDSPTQGRRLKSRENLNIEYDSYLLTDYKQRVSELEQQNEYLLLENKSLKQAKSQQDYDHEQEIMKLKDRVEKEKEDMKQQFKAYWDEIKVIYDKEKEKIKKKKSDEVIEKSIHEVNMMFSTKIDYLQNELLITRTEASSKILELANQIKELQELNKAQEDIIANQK